MYGPAPHDCMAAPSFGPRLELPIHSVMASWGSEQGDSLKDLLLVFIGLSMDPALARSKQIAKKGNKITTTFMI